MGLNDQTRTQLLAVSGATIDRMLKPTRDSAQSIGLSGTKAGPLLRNWIQVRKASDEHEKAPGFVEADLVLHGGPTLQNEFVHSLTVTDVFIGWIENLALKNSTHRWMIEAMTQIEARLPFPLVGLDNHALAKYARGLLSVADRALRIARWFFAHWYSHRALHQLSTLGNDRPKI